MTHFWRDGLAVAVECAPDGAPIVVHWHGSHRVDRIVERWRLDHGWWRGRVWRDYWLVATHGGLLLVLFQDYLRPGWFVQRLYD